MSIVRRSIRFVLVIGLSGLCSSRAAADPLVAVVEPDKLYLRTGAVDTAVEPNLLVPGAAAFEAGRRYVVQLDGPMTPARRTALQAAAVVLEDYLPTNAYIARLDQAGREALAALGFVQWVGAYADSWRVDPNIGQRVEPFTMPERVQLAAEGKVQLVATLFAGEDANSAITQLAALGAEVKGWNPVGDHAVIDLVLPADAVQGLAALATVQFVEEAPEAVMRNNTNEWIIQSNVSGQTPIWAHGIHGEGQIGGLIDSPMDENHCSFDDSVPPGLTHRKIVAYRGTYDAGTAAHGTHVAGSFLGDYSPYGQANPGDGIAFAAKVSS